jgi:hypothetical protein
MIPFPIVRVDHHRKGQVRVCEPKPDCSNGRILGKRGDVGNINLGVVFSTTRVSYARVQPRGGTWESARIIARFGAFALVCSTGFCHPSLPAETLF